MIKNNIKLYFVLSVLILSASGMMQNNAFAVESADLGTAESFVILSGGPITNNVPGQLVTGDTGHVGTLTAPFTYVTGSDFAGAGSLGTTATPGTPLGDARTVYDTIGIYNNATTTGLACTFTFLDGAVDLAATTETGGVLGEYGPGVYCINGAASIGGAGININATGSVVFKIYGAFTTVTGSSVTFSGTASSNADSGNLFFVSGGPAAAATVTTSGTSQFSGNVMTGAGAITIGADTDATNARFISESAITIGGGANIFSILTPSTPVPSSGDGADDKRSNTKPTFGISYQTNKHFVTDGFGYGTSTKTITDNFHTDFDMVDIPTGVEYPFYAKGYFANGLKIQEFCFGIPEPGKGYLAESCIEVHFDYGYGDDKTITDIKVIQNSKVIGNVSATHDMASCTVSDKAKVCDKTMITIAFAEPLQHSVMMIKGIDQERFVSETYLNEGFNVNGKQLTDLQTAMIPSPTKYEGLIQVTQSEKYSNIWISDDKRVFERNDFGSFNQINQTYEKIKDVDDMKNRIHSAFAGWKDQQAIKAKNIWDASKYVSTLAPSFTYAYPVEDPRTTFLKEHNMLEFVRGQ